MGAFEKEIKEFKEIIKEYSKEISEQKKLSEKPIIIESAEKTLEWFNQTYSKLKDAKSALKQKDSFAFVQKGFQAVKEFTVSEYITINEQLTKIINAYLGNPKTQEFHGKNIKERINEYQKLTGLEIKVKKEKKISRTEHPVFNKLPNNIIERNNILTEYLESNYPNYQDIKFLQEEYELNEKRKKRLTKDQKNASLNLQAQIRYIHEMGDWETKFKWKYAGLETKKQKLIEEKSFASKKDIKSIDFELQQTEKEIKKINNQYKQTKKKANYHQSQINKYKNRVLSANKKINSIKRANNLIKASKDLDTFILEEPFKPLKLNNSAEDDVNSYSSLETALKHYRAPAELKLETKKNKLEKKKEKIIDEKIIKINELKEEYDLENEILENLTYTKNKVSEFNIKKNIITGFQNCENIVNTIKEVGETILEYVRPYAAKLVHEANIESENIGKSKELIVNKQKTLKNIIQYAVKGKISTDIIKHIDDPIKFSDKITRKINNITNKYKPSDVNQILNGVEMIFMEYQNNPITSWTLLTDSKTMHKYSYNPDQHNTNLEIGLSKIINKQINVVNKLQNKITNTTTKLDDEITQIEYKINSINEELKPLEETRKLFVKETYITKMHTTTSDQLFVWAS